MKHRIALPLILVFSLLLASCGASGSSAGPAAVMTNTPVPGGAGASTEIPAADATAADATAAPAEATAAPADALSGACANAYYPVTPGASWSYNGSSATGGAFSFTRSVLSVAADGFEDQDIFDGGVTRTGTWTCNAGALTALDEGGAAMVSVPTDEQTAVFNADTREGEGVTVPAQMNPGDAWTQHVYLAGTMSMPGGIEAAATSDTTNSCVVDGTESVSVTAGTFDAVRVTCAVVVTITTEVEGMTIDPITMSFNSTNWYASGVGLVKTTSTGDLIGESNIELTGYSIP